MDNCHFVPIVPNAQKKVGTREAPVYAVSPMSPLVPNQKNERGSKTRTNRPKCAPKLQGRAASLLTGLLARHGCRCLRCPALRLALCCKPGRWLSWLPWGRGVKKSKPLQTLDRSPPFACKPAKWTGGTPCCGHSLQAIGSPPPWVLPGSDYRG